jgi:flagellar biogenesis protein FliO
MIDLFTETPASSIELVISLILKLGLVILIIVALLSLMRYVKTGFSASFNKHLHLIETLHLSPKQKLFLIQVGNRTLLISAADEQIALLGEVELTNVEQNPQVNSFTRVQTPQTFALENFLKNMRSKFKVTKTRPETSSHTTEAQETCINNI